MSEEKINVMVLKRDGLGDAMARSLNLVGRADDILFRGTSSEQEAIDAFNSGEVSVVVSGIFGINWQRVAESVGKENLIVFSALSGMSEEREVIEAGITSVPMDLKTGNENLFAAIRRTATRQ